MPEEQKEAGIAEKLYLFVKQSPLIAVVFWLGWRNIKLEERIDNWKKQADTQIIENEKFTREQLIYYRAALMEEKQQKEKVLMSKYEIDSTKN